MNLKKLFASVASVMILASTLPTTVLGAASYSEELQGAYDYAYGIGITTKSSIGQANMLGTLKRVDMAKMMANYAVEVLGKTPDTSKSCDFNDVSNETSEMQSYVVKACQLGLMGIDANGDANDSFNPQGIVTRAQFGTVLSRALYGDVNEGGTPYYAEHLQALKDAGIMTNISNPNSLEIRGYVMLMMQRADDNGGANADICKTEENVVNCGLGLSSCPSQCQTKDDEVKSGSLKVSLNSNSADDGTQIPATGTVRFAVVDFSASTEDVSLKTVELKKVGLVTIPSNTRVWFEKDGVRVSGKAAFTSEGTAVLSFAPTYVVKAGERVSFDLYAEIATSEGKDFQFASEDIISSAEDVNWSFTTPKLRTADYTVAPVNVTKLSNGGTFNIDANSQEVGAFKIENQDNSPENRDVKFKSITFRQDGNGDLPNLDNIVLERNGSVIAKNPIINGKDLTFSLSDTIKDGTTATYYIKAKVTDVDNSNGDEYKFTIRNTTDVNASETTSTAFRSTVKLNGLTSSLTLDLYTVKGANITFAKDSSVELSKNYAAGSDDVVLMQGTINAKSAITLEDPSLTYSAGTGLSRLFTTIYLKVGNSTFSFSPTDAANGTAAFLGTVTINSSASVKMYGKLRDTAPVATVKFNDLKLGSFGRAEYVANSNTVAGAVGSVAGVNVTVQGSILNVTKSDALGDTSIAQGMKSLLVYGVRLSSDQGNGATVSNIKFDVASNQTAKLYDNAYATLYINGEAKQSKTINGATLTFDSFNVNVTKTNTITMEVKVDFADAFDAGTFKLTLNDLTAVDKLTSKDITSFTKPVGAMFTIAAAAGTVASSDNNPQAQLFLSPSVAQKLVAFKLTAKNDDVRLYNVNLTGVGLDGLSNFKLVNNAGEIVATANSATSTAVTFTEIANAPKVLKDKSETYYVVADVNSNTVLGTVKMRLTSADIKSTNGSVIAVTWSPVDSRVHGTSENTMVVTKATNSSKLLTTSALRFTVAAAGKDSVTLTGLNFNNQLAGYTGTVKVIVYKNSVSTANKAWELNASTGLVPLNANNTVDAGSSVTYIVVLDGALINSSSNTQDWSVSLTDVLFGGLSASSYDNAGAFPITETK